MALLDSGATDPVTGDAITLFTSAQKPVTVTGGDITATYKLTPQLEASVAAERFKYNFSESRHACLRPPGNPRLPAP
jgi:outer membrane receptor for ferrienterochelin and colicins